MKMLSEYILDFLRKGNELSLNGFGSFSLVNSGSCLDSDQKKLLPPSRQIVFVESIHSPEIFAQYISAQDNISVEEAIKMIDETIEHWKNQLSEKGLLEIEGIGNFKKDGNQLVFSGIRLEDTAPDFYGLENIDLDEVKHGRKNKITSENKEYRFEKSVLWTFLLILPVAGLIFLAFTQRDRLFGKQSFSDISVRTSTGRIKDKPVSKPVKKDSITVQQSK